MAICVNSIMGTAASSVGTAAKTEAEGKQECGLFHIEMEADFDHTLEKEKKFLFSFFNPGKAIWGDCSVTDQSGFAKKHAITFYLGAGKFKMMTLEVLTGLAYDEYTTNLGDDSLGKMLNELKQCSVLVFYPKILYGRYVNGFFCVRRIDEGDMGRYPDIELEKGTTSVAINL